MEEFIKKIARAGSGAGARKSRFAAVTGFILPYAAMAILSALLAAYRPFEGIAPFGAACVIAAWASGESPFPACFGAVIGHALAGSWTYAAACFGIGLFAFAAERKLKLEKTLRMLLGFASEALILLVISLITRRRVLATVSSASISVLGAVVLYGAVLALKKLKNGRAVSDTELLTLSAAAGLATLSMGSFQLFGQSPAMLFAGISALIIAYRLGTSAVAFAVTIGAGRVLASGGDMHFIAVLAAGTLAAAAMRGLGKWASLAAFAVINIAFRAVLGGTGVFSYPECLIACGVFALIPARLINGDSGAGKRSVSGYNRLQYRVGELSAVLGELSEAAEPGDARIFGCISETLRRLLNSAGRASERAFDVEYGSAEKTAPGSACSGDSLAVRETDDALLIAISDGMGSGDEASTESRQALKLLLDLISVGFSMEQAIGFANKSLARTRDGDMYATLDALYMDLSGGSARLVKYGAPPSYILRGGKVFTIYSEALPMGIIEDAEGHVQSVKLKSGDTVIMMSDGAADALGSSLLAAITDNVLAYGDPEMAANALMDEAMRFGAEDDMTVIVARVEERI